MPLTAQDVEDILRYLDASPFDELDLEMDGMSLHLRRTAGGIEIVEAPAAVETSQSPAPKASAPPAPDGLSEIRSTFLGTFYRASRPGETPFTELGARVEADTVVGIVEVMKLMNSVAAGVAGEIAEICADDGALVEYGQLLFRVKTDNT